MSPRGPQETGPGPLFGTGTHWLFDYAGEYEVEFQPFVGAGKWPLLTSRQCHRRPGPMAHGARRALRRREPADRRQRSARRRAGRPRHPAPRRSRAGRACGLCGAQAAASRTGRPWRASGRARATSAGERRVAAPLRRGPHRARRERRGSRVRARAARRTRRRAGRPAAHPSGDLGGQRLAVGGLRRRNEWKREFPVPFLRPAASDGAGRTTADLHRVLLPPGAFCEHFPGPLPALGDTLGVLVTAGAHGFVDAAPGRRPPSTARRARPPRAASGARITVRGVARTGF